MSTIPMAVLESPSNNGSSPSAEMTRVVLDGMGDTWRHDPRFFKRFFPINTRIKQYSINLKRSLYNNKIRRWKGIRSRVTSVASLSTNFLFLLNNVLQVNGLDKNRRFFKTKQQKVNSNREIFTSPSIFLAGTGPEFMNTGIEHPFAQCAQGIAPFEVRLQSSDNAPQGRGRLAAHAYAIFREQENRRFLFGVVLTEQTLSICMFDHSGAVYSDPLDYHENPEHFCAVILGLASNNATGLGFDHTMYREGRIPKLRTNEIERDRRTRQKKKLHGDGITYTVVERLCGFKNFVGKGTICWLAHDDRTKQEYAIKDSWVNSEELSGKESEVSLLSHARSKGVVQGIPQVRHYEVIQTGSEGNLDTVMHNRRLGGQKLDYSIERIHTRTVLGPRGRRLDEFSTPQEFILAFHDAFLAHRNLYEKAGILHRDVSVANILINPGGEEGNRGILIDYDSAIRVGDNSPYSTKTGIGTWPCKSRNVLKRGPHTYIDDLESFFYVLCFIIAGYAGPSMPAVPPSVDLSSWQGKAAFGAKHGLIVMDFDLDVSEWFGEPLRNLGIKMHSFFKERNWVELQARHEGRPCPTHIPSDDYDEFTNYIRQAIMELGDTPPRPPPVQSAAGTPDTSGSRDTFYTPPPRRKPVVPRQPPAQRARRTTAHYS